MNATELRRQHIANIRANVVRLQSAVIKLKANLHTIEPDDYSWEGDLGHIAWLVQEATEQAVNCAAASEPVRLGSPARLVSDTSAGTSDSLDAGS